MTFCDFRFLTNINLFPILFASHSCFSARGLSLRPRSVVARCSITSSPACHRLGPKCILDWMPHVWVELMASRITRRSGEHIVHYPFTVGLGYLTETLLSIAFICPILKLHTSFLELEMGGPPREITGWTGRRPETQPSSFASG